MSLVIRLITLIGLLLPTLLAPLTVPAASDGNQCLYPSLHKRFGITVSPTSSQGGLAGYNVAVLGAGGWHNWIAIPDPPHPNGMDYYPMIHVHELDPAYAPYGYSPNGERLERLVRANPGATWLIGNEADYRWHNDYATPEAYARIYHDIYTTIKRIDPSAKIASNSLATVSTLRLAWLDRVWEAYRELYDTDMPVDVWAIHSYVVNEMVHEWGPDFPPGFVNVVGYGAGTWEEVADPEASGGTVHRSNEPGARAYFAFAGDWVTLYLRTGPGSGIVNIYRDRVLVDTVDLYSPTPGVLRLTYTDLPTYSDPHLGDRHHIRVTPTGLKNPASRGFWATVDAIEAPSTAELANGRLEDNDPMQARILTSVDDHDNLDAIVEQIRMMRQWMADHGQRHKPLINTEYGVLIGEEYGFTYERVRDFMLGSFDLFINDNGLVDPDIGMPEDGERLLQQWFWFTLALDHFNGSRVHTGLFDPATKQLLPLGQVYSEYVRSLVQHYSDVEVAYLRLIPDWPLFAGEQSLVRVEADIRNLGNQLVGAFWIRLAEGTRTIEQWQADGLAAAHEQGDTFHINFDWTPVLTSDRSLTLTADSAGQVDEPCAPNNSRTETVTVQPFTDLTLQNVAIVPAFPDTHTDTLTLQAEVTNLGSLGTTADQIVVSIWDGDPDHGGVLLHRQRLLPGNNLRTTTVTFEWRDFSPGQHEIIFEIEPVADDINPANNVQRTRVLVPDGSSYQYMPALFVGQ